MRRSVRMRAYFGLCLLFAVVCGTVFAFAARWLLRTPRCRDPATCPTRTARMWGVGGVEGRSLVVWVRCGVVEQPWVVDTGFAGPPVLSLPWIARGGWKERGRARRCEETYASTTDELARSPPSEQTCRRALDRFMADCNANAFTAGCTTTLMGIGASSVSNSDMILAPPLELLSPSGAFLSARSCSGAPNADVLSTTRMQTASLITCDWLRQNGPCLIAPRAGELRVGVDGNELLHLRSSHELFANELSGGAFVARVSVGGTSFRLTVDTGSALTISLGTDAAKSLLSCDARDPMHVQQQGVNGERVCSSVVWSRADVAGRSLDTPVFLNDHGIEQVDGYIGLGILECFDVLVTRGEMRLRFVADDVDARSRLVDASRGGWCGVPPRCAARAAASAS